MGGNDWLELYNTTTQHNTIRNMGHGGGEALQDCVGKLLVGYWFLLYFSSCSVIKGVF